MTFRFHVEPEDVLGEDNGEWEGLDPALVQAIKDFAFTCGVQPIAYEKAKAEVIALLTVQRDALRTATDNWSKAEKMVMERTPKFTAFEWLEREGAGVLLRAGVPNTWYLGCHYVNNLLTAHWRVDGPSTLLGAINAARNAEPHSSPVILPVSR